jgi:hypothetical protein
MVVNVVTPLRPHVYPWLMDLHDLDAESAPEALIAVSSHATPFELLLHCSWAIQAMVPQEMIFEGLATMAHFVTSCLFAVPRFKLQMLAALMPLPVILAAKHLMAVSKGASVRLLMPLEMFLQLARSVEELLAFTALVQWFRLLLEGLWLALLVFRGSVLEFVLKQISRNG